MHYTELSLTKYIEIFRNKSSNKMKHHQTPAIPPRIAVIGELNADLIASGLAFPPRLGREVLAEDFRTVLGSASAIFACGAARLQHPVTFFSQIGDDELGRFCLETLRTEGISTEHVRTVPRARTGVTISLSTRSDRALVTMLGLISRLRYADLDLQALRGHSHLHLTSYFLQTALQPSFPRLLRRARKMGLTTSFDPNSDPSAFWGGGIWGAIAETTILFVNKEEALLLTRKRSIQAALEQLAKEAPCVVIKLGRDGAVAASGKERAKAPGFEVSAVDTTGAGDSFAAGFVHAYVSGRDLHQCLVEGNACGALSTLQVGGTAGQPRLAQLSRFLARKRNHLRMRRSSRR